MQWQKYSFFRNLRFICGNLCFYLLLHQNTFKSMTKGYTQKTESGYEDLKEALIEFKAVQNGEAQSRPLEKMINEL